MAGTYTLKWFWILNLKTSDLNDIRRQRFHVRNCWICADQCNLGFALQLRNGRTIRAKHLLR